jgi:hypothetical protein
MGYQSRTMRFPVYTFRETPRILFISPSLGLPLQRCQTGEHDDGEPIQQWRGMTSVGALQMPTVIPVTMDEPCNYKMTAKTQVDNECLHCHRSRYNWTCTCKITLSLAGGDSLIRALVWTF